MNKKIKIVISYNTDSKIEETYANIIHKTCLRNSTLEFKLAPLTEEDIKSATVMLIVASKEEDLFNSANKSCWSKFIELANTDSDKKYVVLSDELPRSFLLRELKVIGPTKRDSDSLLTLIKMMNDAYIIKEKPKKVVVDQPVTSTSNIKVEETPIAATPTSNPVAPSGQNSFRFTFLTSRTYNINFNPSTFDMSGTAVEDGKTKTFNFSLKKIRNISFSKSDYSFTMIFIRGENYSNLLDITADENQTGSVKQFLLRFFELLKQVNGNAMIDTSNTNRFTSIIPQGKDIPVSRAYTSTSKTSSNNNSKLTASFKNYKFKSFSQSFEVAFDPARNEMRILSRLDTGMYNESFSLSNITELEVKHDTGSYYSVYISNSPYTGMRKYNSFSVIHCDNNQGREFIEFLKSLETYLLNRGINFKYTGKHLLNK